MRDGIYDDEPWTYTGIGWVLGISKDRVKNLESDGYRGLWRLGYTIDFKNLYWRKRTKEEEEAFFDDMIISLLMFFGLIVIIAIVLGFFILG